MVDYAKSRMRTADVSVKSLAMIEGRRRTAGTGVTTTPYDYRSKVGGKELVVFEHMVINAMSYISPVGIGYRSSKHSNFVDEKNGRIFNSLTCFSYLRLILVAEFDATNLLSDLII